MKAWQCETCGEIYAEYVNGCPKCWHGDSSRGCVTHEPQVRSKVTVVEIPDALVKGAPHWALKIIVCVAMLLAMQAAAQSKKHIVCPRGQHPVQYCWSGDFGWSGCDPEKCEDDKPKVHDSRISCEGSTCTIICGKYQHIENSRLYCPHIGEGAKDVCIWSANAKDYCADNLHTVTEREWIELDLQRRMMSEEIRELKDRLRALESK